MRAGPWASVRSGGGGSGRAVEAGAAAAGWRRRSARLATVAWDLAKECTSVAFSTRRLMFSVWSLSFTCSSVAARAWRKR